MKYKKATDCLKRTLTPQQIEEAKRDFEESQNMEHFDEKKFVGETKRIAKLIKVITKKPK